MKRKLINALLFALCVTLVLITASPLMAYEPVKGKQLALKGVNANDAEAAMNDESSKTTSSQTSEQKTGEPPQNIQTQTQETKVSEQPQNTQADVKEEKVNESPKSIEEELKELRQEIKKIRGENEARKKLEIPEEQKSESVEDILSAVGRQYSLLRKGTVALSYTFSYSYFSGDVIDESAVVLRRVNHNFNNTIAAEYALFNNLTLSSSFPFVYKYNKVGTDESLSVTDLGDISLGLAWQPFKAGGRIPSTILSFGVSLPTGSSPYEINYNDELSTGSGHYAFQTGISLSKVIDPLVAFGSLNYTYALPETGLSQIIYEDPTDPSNRIYLTEVEPGQSFGLAFGFGYALSYQASMNLAGQLGYSLGSKYKNAGSGGASTESSTGSTLSASLNIGTGWRITAARSVYASMGIGLTNNDPDVSISLKFPFEF
jgi:flagellar motor protein MotB